MPRFRTTILLACTFFCASLAAQAQGNIDWAEMWKLDPAVGQASHPLSWMTSHASYTSLAYDSLRNVLYVVSPRMEFGASQPRVLILDADDGTQRTDIGRSAHFTRAGLGGELPVPLDTFITSSGKGLGYEDNRFALYKLRVDDEGRIYACNLVSPLWRDGQGPLRVWRWDTPVSTPVLVYATMDSTASSIGSETNSELPEARWGDSFDVVGMRKWHYPPFPGVPELRDSVRIYVSGGRWSDTTLANMDIAVLVPDTRPAAQRPSRDVTGGGKLELRLATLSHIPGNAGAHHGLTAEHVAVTGDSVHGRFWFSDGRGITSAYPESQLLQIPLPQAHFLRPTDERRLSTNLAGRGGALQSFVISGFDRTLLVIGDAVPSNLSDTSQPNLYTQSRMLDVTTPGTEFKFWSDTPPCGTRLTDSLGPGNFIADVASRSQRVDIDGSAGNYYLYLWLYYLNAGNGIVGYRARKPAFVPVELTAMELRATGRYVTLSWTVAYEENTLGYSVSRRMDTGPWQPVTFVPGMGDSHEMRQYLLRDTIPASFSGRLSYRLAETATDGTVTELGIRETVIAAAPAAPSVSIYPNPSPTGTAATHVLIDGGNPGTCTLLLHDMLGRTLLREQIGLSAQGTADIRLPLSGLRRGRYILSVLLPDRSRLDRALLLH